MMRSINETHDINLESWVESANGSSDFPIQNLPYCVFQTGKQAPAIGVGIGDQILNLKSCVELGLIGDEYADELSQPRLNSLMSLSVEARVKLRSTISELLKRESTTDKSVTEKALLFQSDAQLLMPCQIGDYTDFYASVYHATNVGSMFRPNNPLLPNYKHIPIGYHGRASSIVASGASFPRPVGQLTPAEEGGAPTRQACKLLDYELEVGCLIAQGNELGSSISIEEAEDYIFGLTMLNDWSARDIQKWEYQPLGPFLAKSFISTISPWVVTLEALAPFRCAAFERPADDPQPLPYLTHEANSQNGGFDLKLEAYLASSQMREQGIDPIKLSTGCFSDLYWTLGQMVTHHSSNGCNLQPGDMLGSGTVSGLARESRGCLLELTWDGDRDNPVPGTQRTPIQLPTGEERKFLADGDQVIFKGYCENGNYRRIGFGTCEGTVLPAVQS